MYDGMPPVYNVKLDCLNDAINLSFQYIKKEYYNQKLFNYLIKNTSDENEITLLNSIKNDMNKHQCLLKNFFLYFNGKNPPITEKDSFIEPADFIEGIQTAFFNNQRYIDLFTNFYILMIQSVCNESFTNMAFEILQDVQKHNAQYNFMLNNQIFKKLNSS
ncbi:hypothetical protein [Haloimpatiens massiliensis]|uniref:hypothetical protein n=1 Tax=Haloimpatiens massiliensis TaxID=1658110 RepID=UPI000C84AEBF|nr:hypothetical protein [Haloimpatiens massiliensis]